MSPPSVGVEVRTLHEWTLGDRIYCTNRKLFFNVLNVLSFFIVRLPYFVSSLHLNLNCVYNLESLFLKFTDVSYTITENTSSICRTF